MYLKRIVAFLMMMTLISIYSQDNVDDLESLFDDIPAEEEQSSSESTETGGFSMDSGFTLSLLGEHAFRFAAPVTEDHLDFEGYKKSPKFLNELGLIVEYKTLKVVSNWSFNLILNEWGDIEQVVEIAPLENSITWSPWKFNIQAGFLYHTWGTADKQNPTDNLNPRDLRMGLDNEKLPVLSAAVKFYPVDFLSLETVYIPFYMKSLMPMDITDEVPEEIFHGKMLDLTALPDQKVLTIKHSKDVEYIYPEFDPNLFVLGGKVSFFFRYIDFSFSYLYDMDDFWTPEIELDKVEDAMGLMTFYRVDEIDLVRGRVHRIGADMKTNIDRFGLWLELSFNLSEDFELKRYQIRNHQLNWTLGFDFNYGPNDDFYFNAQYIGSFNLDFDDKFYTDYEDGKPDEDELGDEDYMEEYYYRAFTNKLGGVYEGLTQALIIAFEWPVLNSMLTPKLAAGYFLPLVYDYTEEIRYGGMLLKPELLIKPLDAFEIAIGAELVYAWHKKAGNDYVELQTENSQIGTFHKDSNVYIEARYKWGFDFTK